MIKFKRKNRSANKQKVAETFIRAQTPTPIETKVCRSPGGMRLLTSVSGKRIKKKSAKTISLINFGKKQQVFE